MTTTRTATRTAVPGAAARTGSLIWTGVAAAAVASGATTIVAAAGHAAGISLDMGGAPIPVLGFAMLTVVFSLFGLALAAVLSRTARHPHRTFIRTTVVLTAVSLIPDVLADATSTTRALLMVTHLVAAAIVIPSVARRLSVCS
ncbi:MAG: DUF6069 family protein [Pseudonocardiaceae bacterium]